jgi:hypothetical protein
MTRHKKQTKKPCEREQKKKRKKQNDGSEKEATHRN